MLMFDHQPPMPSPEFCWMPKPYRQRHILGQILATIENSTGLPMTTREDHHRQIEAPSGKLLREDGTSPAHEERNHASISNLDMLD